MEQNFFLVVGTVVLAVATVAFFKVFNRLKRFYLIRKNLREEWKGPDCHWFWGHLGMITQGNKFPERYIDYYTEKEKEFPFGFTVYGGPFTAFLRLHHPLFVKEVLHASVWEAPKSYRIYSAFLPWTGNGLGTLNYNEWLQHRRLLTPAFHFQILRSYVRKMNDCASTMLAKWSRLAESNNPCTVEIFEHSSVLALDNILRCLISVTTNCQERTDDELVVSLNKLSELFLKRIKSRSLLSSFEFFYRASADGKEFYTECDIVHEYSYSLIKERKKKMLDGSKEKEDLDFLDILLQAKDSDGVGFTDTEIRSEVDTIILAGHDTVSSALSWTFYCLASHTEHQEICFKEVSSVMKDRNDVIWSDLSSFPYLTRCIKESLRMYPPAPRCSRTLNKDIHVQGKTILKGTMVAISIDGVQRSELFWKHPQQFNPARFTTEKAAEQNNFAFIPFSAGPRNCIGQNFAMNELKITIAKVLKRFKLDVCPNQTIVPCVEVTYRAKGGIKLNLTPRV